LGVPYIAGTLVGLNPCGDTLHDRAETCGLEFRSNRGGRMSETIAYEHIIGFWVFLVDAFAEIRFNELLLAVNAVIDRRTAGCAAEAVFNCRQFR
jgi:hypothetical protein